MIINAFMNTLSRTITGIALTFLGAVLIAVSFAAPPTLIYGIPMFIIGIVLFFNKKEDEIEQIKDETLGGAKDDKNNNHDRL